ncbi:hypothetical protein J6590_076919 [Homalodisca vitripennis]|nr:hypothetical protein J6590_076919 [Homalodisca vitripennis]
MIAAPFAWHNTTCVLQHETTYVAASDKRIASISGGALHDCQVFERPLCFVPRYPGDSLASSLCHRKLFEGATTEGNKEPGGVGERPLAIPLATLHGKELRITIEENCAAEVTDTFSTGD